MLLLRAVQQPTVVKLDVCVFITKRNNLIQASASPFGPEKLVLSWVRGNSEKQSEDGKDR